MELSKWVVRVYLKKNSGTYILGTGIPVLRGYILTATHVLKDDRELRDQEIIIQDYQGNDTQHLSVEDIAYLSDANDLALIRSNHFDRIAEKFPVSISLPRVDQRFHSSAFPSFIAKDDAVNVFPLSGALLHTTGDSLESLTVDQGVVNREQWRGASGAPVIAGGCIVGVLSKVPKYTNNTMSYTSIRSVYDADERFKQFFEAKETDQKFIQYVNRMAIKQFEKVSESFLEEWCIEASIDDVDENYATQLVAFQDIEDLFTSLNQVLSRPGV
ncbi:MAG: trypsin-like serine protease, partial [Pontibacterium sp.]